MRVQHHGRHFVGVALSLLAVVLAPLPVRAQELPAIPAPAPVTVEHGTTALLVLDITEPLCTLAPSCRDAILPASKLLVGARDAGPLIVHSQALIPNSTPVDEVAPLAEEPSVTGPPDKFTNTNPDELLKARGIKTLVLTGVAANGAVLYTATAANVRGYTVIVAEDSTASGTPFETYLAQYQLLHQPGRDNPANEPLRKGAVTLSLSDLIEMR